MFLTCFLSLIPDLHTYKIKKSSRQYWSGPLGLEASLYFSFCTMTSDFFFFFRGEGASSEVNSNNLSGFVTKENWVEIKEVD